MRPVAELVKIAYSQNLSAEEEDSLYRHYKDAADCAPEVKHRVAARKHAAFFAARAFDKGKAEPEHLSEYAAMLQLVQQESPTASFRRKLNEMKLAKNKKGADESVLKRLGKLGDAGNKKVLASSYDLDELEARVNIKLPQSYRIYLSKYAHRQIGTFEPFKVSEIYSQITVKRAEGLNANLIPFLEDNADLYCFDVSTKAPDFAVVFVPHDGTSDESWPNFSTWVEECWVGELGD